jgi:hypothetical protein
MSKKLTQNIKPATEHEVLALAKGAIGAGDVEAIFPGVDEVQPSTADVLDGIVLGWNRREELNTLVEAEKNAASVAGLIQKVGFDEFFAQLRNLSSEMQNDPAGFAEKFGVSQVADNSSDQLLTLMDVVIEKSAAFTSAAGKSQETLGVTTLPALLTRTEQIELLKNPEGIASLMTFHLEAAQSADESNDLTLKAISVARYVELKELGARAIEQSAVAWPFALRNTFGAVTADEVCIETAAAAINEGELADWITDQIENGHSGFTTEISGTMARYALAEPAELRLELAERMAIPSEKDASSTSIPKG